MTNQTPEELAYHYSDNPYPEDPPRTEDTCWACYEADPDERLWHKLDCEIKDIHLRVKV